MKFGDSKGLRAFLLGLALLFSAGEVRGETDYNNDGLCDVWQQVYDAWDLLPGEDTDGDGCSNWVESLAGTDPRNPRDCVRFGGMSLAGNTVVFQFKAQAGKRYDVTESSSPTGVFTAVAGSAMTPSEDRATETIVVNRQANQLRFYRLRVQDVDSDGDGLADWAEMKMGTDPHESHSPTNASGGMASDGETLASLMSVTLEVEQEAGYEREDKSAATPAVVPARIRVRRTVGNMPLTLAVKTAGGAPSLTKGNASPADYVSNQVLTIPSGAASAVHEVIPVPDEILEVPEYLEVTMEAGAVQRRATVCICDAKPEMEANRTLYVAYLGKEAGVNTVATGLATALVRGDNDQAVISLTFSNLTSPQNTAYLRVENDDLINIGLGQVAGRGWAIRAASTKVTDQAMLSALNAGQLYISITTADNPTGEIRGYFNRASGSTDFTLNPAIHEAPELGGDNWQVPTVAALHRDIWRFLDQATFGGTDALHAEVLAEVNQAIANGGTYLEGYEAWLDKQMNPAITPNPSLLQLVVAADNEEFVVRGNKPIWAGNDPRFAGVSYGASYDAFGNPIIGAGTNGTYNNNHPSSHNRRREMWTLAMEAKAQVRQRMAMALSEIVVISEMDATVQSRHYGAANYWDMLAEHAFGKYRTVLENVTYSPMMGIYLSHIRNRAEHVSGGVPIYPDENYAREIMQLFSIGLVLRHPDGSLVLDGSGLPVPTYDNEDIAELARVLTGFCHGARHQTAAVQRFNGLHFTTSSPRVGANVEIQGGLNTAGSSFTNFSEGAGETWFQAPWLYPMKVLGRDRTTVFHDFGQKVLLEGKVGETVIPAQVLPASGGTTVGNANDQQTHGMAAQDVALAHNLLAGDPAAGVYNGHPNTPINLSRWLIQRFTTSNPSAGYIYRVSEVYRQSNGDLGRVLKAILLDYEARSLQLADRSISHGRMKEPLVHFMSVMRGLNAYSGIPLTSLRDVQQSFAATDAMTLNGWPGGLSKTLPQSEVAKYRPNATRFRFPDSTTVLGQSPLRAPSVFNWFLPDYVVPGPMAEAGLFAPEMQIASETNLVNRINRLWTFTWMSLQGMATFPGVDVDDITNVSPNNAAPQVKVMPPGVNVTANSFLPLATLTFTAANWNSPQTVTVAAVDDSEIEGQHQTTISHRAISSDSRYNQLTLPTVDVTINDNEVGSAAAVVLEESGGRTLVVEGGATDTYTMRLASGPVASVTVHVQAHVTGTTPPTQVTVSPSSVTFTPADWSTPQTFTVTAVDDANNEGPHVGIIGHYLVTNDPVYSRVHAPSVQAIVADNENHGSNAMTITQTQNSTIVVEGGATDTLMVTLRRAPTAGSTVTVQPGANSQVTLSPPSLAFTSADWNIPQFVTVAAVDDALVEGTHTTTVALSATGGGYNLSSNVTVTIHDNDGGGATVVESGGSTVVTEGGFDLANRDSYTIRLNTAPTANVTVEVMPQRHVQRASNHAKMMGYFTSDLSAGNLQKDRIIFDYSGIIALYHSAFGAAGGVGDTNNNNRAAHFAATTAVVDKFDRMWCGGQLKAQWPEVTLADLSNPAVVNPRKTILAGVLNGYSTTAGSNTPNNMRDRCRIAAYLVSLSPQSFTSK
jgi:hypothetical protein